MDSTEIAIGATAAVLLFWTVGAYNRLVRLRQALVRAFAPVDEQFQLRQQLLQTLCDTLDAPAGAPEPRAPDATAPDAQLLDALRAACRQADSAHARARARPGSAKAISSLRLAEEILADTRARVTAAAGDAAPGLAELNARLAASDATLGFARRQFNEAVAVYNEAVRQFPTWLIAGLFSFRAGAPL